MRDFKIFIMRVYCVSTICPYIIEPKQEEVKNEISFTYRTIKYGRPWIFE